MTKFPNCMVQLSQESPKPGETTRALPANKESHRHCYCSHPKRRLTPGMVLSPWGHWLPLKSFRFPEPWPCFVTGCLGFCGVSLLTPASKGCCSRPGDHIDYAPGSMVEGEEAKTERFESEALKRKKQKWTKTRKKKPKRNKNSKSKKKQKTNSLSNHFQPTPFFELRHIGSTAWRPPNLMPEHGLPSRSPGKRS